MQSIGRDKIETGSKFKKIEKRRTDWKKTLSARGLARPTNRWAQQQQATTTIQERMATRRVNNIINI